MPEDRLIYLHVLAPPTPGGTPVIVHRLLSRLDGIAVETVTDLLLLKRVRRGGRVIPGPYHYVLKIPPLLDRWRAGRVATAAANAVLALAAGMRAARVARRTRAAWILSVADHGFSVIAGDFAARLTGLPHVIWVFDLWEENAYNDVDRWVASRIERRLLRRATAVLCHAEELAQHYRDKHGIAPVAIPTPIDADTFATGDGGPPATATADPRREVLYAGSLYWAQEEALRRLSRVCRAMPDVRLTVVGDPAQLAAAGIEADAVEPLLAPEAFRDRVRGADAVFLGLSFDSPHPDVVATATPARLPEYMASGTPLLVHAPPGSHVVRYARREDFAEVVDTPDDDALAAGLRRVLDEADVSSMRARRARTLALERHDATSVRTRLRRLLHDLRR